MESCSLSNFNIMKNLVKQKKFQNREVILKFLFIFILFFNIFVLAEERWDWDYENWNYEESLKEQGVKNTIINYLRREKAQVSDARLELKDYGILLVIDTVLAFICLYLAIFLTSGKKTLTTKAYLWFFFIFNIAWFIAMLFLNILWRTLKFFVINLQPNLESAFIDHFSIFIVIFAVAVYIWLLARTFGLNFGGSVSVFLISHVIYFIIIFILSLRFFGNHHILELMRENLGAKAVLRSYLSDSSKITSNRWVLEFFRFRPYHI